MKLTAHVRTNEKKRDSKRIRREGSIPAVIYIAGGNSVMVSVDRKEFDALLRGIPQGRLPTTKFTLMIDGKEKNVLVKDIQYHPTTYNILHLDFEELHKDTLVNVNVPVTCIGVLDCIGIKLGGFLRQVIRSVKVRCLPKDIPASFEVNIKEMGVFQSKRLSDLSIPEGVRPIARMEEVVVVIAKR